MWYENEQKPWLYNWFQNVQCGLLYIFLLYEYRYRLDRNFSSIASHHHRSIGHSSEHFLLKKVFPSFHHEELRWLFRVLVLNNVFWTKLSLSVVVKNKMSTLLVAWVEGDGPTTEALVGLWARDIPREPLLIQEERRTMKSNRRKKRPSAWEGVVELRWQGARKVR